VIKIYGCKLVYFIAYFFIFYNTYQIEAASKSSRGSYQENINNFTESLRQINSLDNKSSIDKFSVDENLNVYNLSEIISANTIPLDLFSEEKNFLIIAFSSKDFHSYLVVDNMQFHSFFYPQKSYVKSMPLPFFKAKFFIKISNLKENDIYKIKTQMKKLSGKGFKSCLDGVCTVLEKSIGLNFPSRNKFLISSLLKYTVANKSQRFGKDDIKIKVFITDSIDYKNLRSLIRKQEKKYFFCATYSFIRYNISF